MSAVAPIQARLALSAGPDRPPRLDVDLRIEQHGITAVFGPSGAGKTTLLRCIAGLERANGELFVQGECWQRPGFFLPAHRRAVGYVFQEASLFSHLSARGNLAYAARRSGASKQDWSQVIELMGLESLLERRPHQLSGGERQRVAIARALLIRPRLLLMDEPLAGLDAAHKRDILPFLEELHVTLELPMIYVSHSLDEVARLSDQIVVMDQGRIRAQGSTTDIMPGLQAPAGEDASVVIQAHVEARDPQWHLARLRFAGGTLWVPDQGEAMGQAVRLRVLARDVSLSRDSQSTSSILNRLPVTLRQIDEQPDGAQAMLRLDCGTTPLLARVTRRSVAELGLQPGDTLFAQLKSVALLR